MIGLEALPSKGKFRLLFRLFFNLLSITVREEIVKINGWMKG